MARGFVSLLATGVLMAGAAQAQPAADQAAQAAAAAACEAREAFEDTLPWTFRGVTYPNQRFFFENFKCGAETFKFGRQSDEELRLAAAMKPERMPAKSGQKKTAQ